MAELLLGLAVLILSEILPGKPSPESIHQVLQPYFQPASPPPEVTPSPVVLGVDQVLVARVIDGDTIELETGQKVRYIGIDTPETQDRRQGVECYGQEAAAKNKELIAGKYVRLEKDISEADRYGRLLRYVYLENQLINQVLVAEGYARAASYPPDIKYQALLRQAESEAQSAARGLWSSCN